MSHDETNDNSVHGRDFKSEHHGVLDYMRKHMTPKEVEQLDHTAKRDSHGAVFTAHIDGEHKTFRLDSSGRVHRAHD